MAYNKNVYGGPVKTQQVISRDKFTFNKSQKEQIVAKGKKLRVLEIILMIIAVAAAVGFVFLLSNFVKTFDTTSGGTITLSILKILFSIVMMAGSLFIPIIPMVIIRQKASKTKDIISLAAVSYSVRGKSVIQTLETEINKELDVQRNSNKRKATKKKYRKK